MKRGIALGLSLLVLGGIAFALLSSTAGATEFGYRFFAPYGRSEFGEDQDLNGNGELDPGEQFAGEFLAVNGNNKTKAHLNFVCVRTSVSPPRDLCEGALKVKDTGVVYIQGVQSAEAEQFRASVLGGANFFAGARGNLELKFGRRGVKMHLTVRI